jgi:putative peptidoglycan lipid II flippase
MSRKWVTSPITKLLSQRQRVNGGAWESPGLWPPRVGFLQSSLTSAPPNKVAAAFGNLRQSSLVRGGLVVGGGILLGNITGFGRVVVTAWFLGTHARADALAVAIGPIDILVSALLNTMLVSFVPMLMLRQEASRAALFHRAGRVFAGILAGVTISLLLLAPELISLLGPGLAREQHEEAVLLLRMVAPAVFFGGCSAIFSALLYTDRRFLTPALYQTCVNGAMIACALSLWKFLGVKGFALGYTLGAAFQTGLTWYASRGLRRARWAHNEAIVPLGEILMRPGMFLLYAGLISANILVTRAYATHAGPGMAAAFDYCLRCVSVVIAYLVYPVANSLLPEIARLRGAGEAPRAYRLMNRSIGLMAAASVLACAVGLAVRTPIISLLFERGSFTAQSTLLVSAVFLGFAPCIVGWTLLDLVSRCFFALDRPKLPLKAAFIPVTVNLTVMLLLGKQSNPALLGLGTSIGLAAGFLALFGAELLAMLRDTRTAQ